MFNYLLKVSFDGTNYYGTQVQDGHKTITGLFNLLISKYLNLETKVTACSRLDRGVHAKEFYMNFKSPKLIDSFRFVYYLNNFLDDDIAVIDCIQVSDNFHARYHALGKVYSYKINLKNKDPFKDRYSFRYPFPLDLNLIDTSLFVGTFDFRNFVLRNDEDENYISTIRKIDYKTSFDEIEIVIKGKSFHRYQIRYMAGAILELLAKRKTKSEIMVMLENKEYNKPRFKAPSKGLTLNEVIYNLEDFKC